MIGVKRGLISAAQYVQATTQAAMIGVKRGADQPAQYVQATTQATTIGVKRGLIIAAQYVQATTQATTIGVKRGLIIAAQYVQATTQATTIGVKRGLIIAAQYVQATTQATTIGVKRGLIIAALVVALIGGPLVLCVGYFGLVRFASWRGQNEADPKERVAVTEATDKPDAREVKGRSAEPNQPKDKEQERSNHPPRKKTKSHNSTLSQRPQSQAQRRIRADPPNRISPRTRNRRRSNHPPRMKTKSQNSTLSQRPQSQTQRRIRADPPNRISPRTGNKRKSKTRLERKRNPNPKVIGSWRDDGRRRRIVIFQREGKTYAEITYDDGSNKTSEMIETPADGGRRFDEKAPINPEARRKSGDHWLIDKAGDLQIRGNEGLNVLAKKIPQTQMVPEPNPPVEESKKRTTLKDVQPDGIRLVVFSPDGTLLASANTLLPSFNDDKTKVWEVKLWDVKTGQEKAILKGHTSLVNSVAFSPDGKTLASASCDETIKLWDVATGKEQATLKGHMDAVWSVAFSPDGKTLASASWDKTIKLWDVATGKEQATLKGHMDAVWSVAFSPDGKTLASASGDKTLKLWDITATRKPDK